MCSLRYLSLKVWRLRSAAACSAGSSASSASATHVCTSCALRCHQRITCRHAAADRSLPEPT